jgi:hypothetical protein
MPDHPELDTYDLAYLYGGPARVVMVALVALSDDGQIKISHALHRVKAVRRKPRDQVESAVFDALPEAGKTLGPLTAAAGATDAIGQIGGSLREQRILARAPWQLSRVIRAHRLRRRLRASRQDGLARIAVHGPAAIADTELREIFQTSDPDFKLPELKLPNLPDHNDRRYDADADLRTAMNLDLFGPDGPYSGL